MSLPSPLKTRRALVGAAVGVGGTGILASALFFSGIIDPLGSAARQEAEIRNVVSTSGVVDHYELTRMPSTSVDNASYTLTLDLETHPDAEMAGNLMSKLFDDSLRVHAIDLVYNPEQRIQVSQFKRDASEWSELVQFGHLLGECNAKLSQLGPAGLATYRLDLVAATADPAANYTALIGQMRPEWITFGDVMMTTSEGVWPKHTIRAGRDLTRQELAEFAELDAQLAEDAGPNGAYELEVITTLGHDRAEFYSRILPDANAPTFTNGKHQDPNGP